jgi:hypothetical protein
MEVNYQAALKGERQGAAYAFLSVIENLYPGHSLLPHAVDSQRVVVLAQAASEQGNLAEADGLYEQGYRSVVLERRANAYVLSSGEDSPALREAMVQAALELL